EKPKAKPKEDFGEVLKRSQVAQPLSTQPQSKTVTEQAIQESAKRQDRDTDERKKDEGEKDKKGETGQKGEQGSSKQIDQRVVGKGTMRQGGGSGGGSGKEGGFESGMGRRSLSKQLSKAGARSVPIDLQSKFASRLAQAARGPDAAQQAALTQQALQKLVQYVRIGINRAGEKEIQVDLHEKIFRGLKLRVTSKGGKIGVHFKTADIRGREVFEKNSDAIKRALAAKGIEVAEFTVS
ncbi:MAG: hypothetical protein WC956_06225, partial [bacterium]